MIISVQQSPFFLIALHKIKQHIFLSQKIIATHNSFIILADLV